MVEALDERQLRISHLGRGVDGRPERRDTEGFVTVRPREGSPDHFLIADVAASLLFLPSLR